MNAVVKTVKAKREIAPVQQESSPMQMLQAAIINKMDPQTIKDLMDLRDRWEATEARKSYMRAVAAFKMNPPKILKDKLNKQYGSKYSSISSVVNTTNAALSPHGLNARWDLKQDEKITVTCILSHELGHSESVSLNGPPDTSGSKNTLQQIKSTITYLEIATFQAVTGVVADEGNLDDDGDSAAMPRISAEQAADLQALLEEVGANKSAFLKYLRLEKLEDITVQAYPDAVKAIERKRKQS